MYSILFSIIGVICLNYVSTVVPNVAVLYKVTAQCEKSRKYIGFRSGAYLFCSDFCGFFDKEESSSCKYSEAGDLEISLLFESEDNARKFINKMIEHCRFFKVTFTHRLDEIPLIEGLQFSPLYGIITSAFKPLMKMSDLQNIHLRCPILVFQCIRSSAIWTILTLYS